jgi:hypothetical protein
MAYSLGILISYSYTCLVKTAGFSPSTISFYLLMDSTWYQMCVAEFKFLLIQPNKYKVTHYI